MTCLTRSKQIFFLHVVEIWENQNSHFPMACPTRSEQTLNSLTPTFSEQTHKPKLEFFQQKEGLSFWRMFLKNTGNCRVACRLMVKTSFSKEMVGEPRFLDIDDVWELEDAESMHLFKDSRKFTAEYVAVKKSESSAEKLLEIEALNKGLQLEITD